MNYADLFRVTLPETALEIAALVVLVVDLAFLRKAALRVRAAVAGLLGVAGCGAALWAIGIQTGQGLYAGGELLLLNGGIPAAASAGIVILTAVTLLLLVESVFTKHAGEYVAVVLMAAAGGMVVAAAQDLLVIFVGLELLSLGLYILTAFNKHSGKSAEAALKYYLFGGMSAAFLLFGFSYFYGLSGSTNLSVIQLRIAETGPTPLLYIAWILVVAGLGFKIAAVPFHLWAPDTYEGAPAPAAAFIASVSKVASFALLLTVASSWLTLQPGQTSGLVGLASRLHVIDRTWTQLAVALLAVAAISMVVGNLAALAQASVRRLLAYSAIAHAGYILLGVAVLPHYSTAISELPAIPGKLGSVGSNANAVLYYILTYGLTTIGAFAAVSVVERATGSDKLDSFLGLSKKNPLLASALMVFFLSLAGIPPLVGFWAKFNLFAAVLKVDAGPVPFALVALAVAMSAVSLYYYLQVLKRAWVMPAADERPVKAHPLTMAVLLAIALAVVGLGCFPALLQIWIESFFG
ncbi:MAG: NADH-quinone oxidoreductase subunit N [Terracidiphilus sp.]